METVDERVDKNIERLGSFCQMFVTSTRGVASPKPDWGGGNYPASQGAWSSGIFFYI
jgi:hypothetical protein